MGGVDFRYVTPPGTRPVTSFQTNFPGVGVSFLGNEWYALLTATGAVAAVSVDTAVNVAGNIGSFTGPGGPLVSRSIFIPTAINYSAVFAKSLVRTQFSQVTIATITGGAGTGVGPMCFASASGDICYGLDLDSLTQAGRLIRGVGTSSTNLTAGILAFVIGDILRLEVDFAPAQNTLRAYKNGVLQNTTIDNGATRPSGGVFGIEMLSLGALGSLGFSNYSGGFV